MYDYLKKTLRVLNLSWENKISWKKTLAYLIDKMSILLSPFPSFETKTKQSMVTTS